MDTLYYGGNIYIYIYIISQRCILGHRFLVVLIRNGDTKRLAVDLNQVQLVFLHNQAINLIRGLEFLHWKEMQCYPNLRIA